MTETDAQLKEASALLNVAPDQVPDRITALLSERKRLENELSAVRRKLAIGESGANESHSDIKLIAGISFVGLQMKFQRSI